MDKNTFHKVTMAVHNGLNIAEVDDRIFVYLSFEASQQSTSQSIDFCSLKGAVEVTELMQMQHIVTNPTAFFQQLQNLVLQSQALTIRFNKFTAKYYLYSAA